MNPPDCMEIYEDAEFYDQEFAERGHEMPFFLHQAAVVNGPVLEVGCGTGRITLPIARKGIAITGLDISNPMLERARRKAAAEHLTVTWLERDCRRIDIIGEYALIFSATNAMQHLHDRCSVSAFLNSAKKALRPGGVLILDIFNPNPAKLARTAAVRYHHKTFVDGAGSELRVEAASQYDTASQILGFTLNYMRDGDLIRTKKVNMRCFFPEELLALCHFNGLEVIHRYGNYDETPFDNHSPKQILICRIAPKT